MKVKQKLHVVKQGDPIPSFTRHKILNIHEQVSEPQSNPSSQNPFRPIQVFMCIHKEEVIVYGSDWFVLEPSFATLREPGGRNYGVLCNFNCHIPNLHGLAIESLGKRQSNIGIMPLQFLTEYQPTTLLKLLCRIFILNKEETRRWLNPIDNFLPLLN